MIQNNFSLTDIRFHFFDGTSRFTVEYCNGLMTWFVFNGREQTNCVFQKKLPKMPKRKEVTDETAEIILLEYLN